MKQKIVLIGAGAWGTAISNVIAINNHDICAISDLSEISQKINEKHTHPVFEGVILNKNLRSSTDLSETKTADKIFIVVPSSAVKSVLQQLVKMDLKENCGFVFATKGLEHSSLKFFHEIFYEIFPKRNFAILSGPNFAVEVVNQAPTITNIASKNEEFAKEVIKVLENDFFKPIYSKEVLVSEISAVIKNIMAISCGICDGLELGENAKAALVVRGCEEIKILAKAYKEESPNIDNPAGFGDIFLTCSTAKSRNNSLGVCLGKGEKYQDLALTKTYEGALNASSIFELSKKLNVKLPLCQMVYEILQDKFSVDEIKAKIIEVVIG